MEDSNDDEMVDMETWEKCPHGYYIDPEEPGFAFKVTGEDENGDLEGESCEECCIEHFSQMLIDNGEDPEQVSEFTKFQKSHLSIQRLLNGPQK